MTPGGDLYFMHYIIGFCVGFLIASVLFGVIVTITFKYDGYLIVNHDEEDGDEIYAEFNRRIDFKNVPFVNLRIKYHE